MKESDMLQDVGKVWGVGEVKFSSQAKNIIFEILRFCRCQRLDPRHQRYKLFCILYFFELEELMEVEELKGLMELEELWEFEEVDDF